MTRSALLATVAACAFATAPDARAEVTPVSVAQGDRRVTTAPFNEDEVVRVPVSKHGVRVVFSQDENRFDVDLGDPSQPGFTPEISSGWLWDRSENTAYFRPWPGMSVETRIVGIVSSLPGGGTRRYQIELVPVGSGAGGGGETPWRRPPGALQARASAADVAPVSDVLPDGPLPGAETAAPKPDVVPAVVRFTYAKQEAEAKIEAARRKREEAAQAWRLANPGAVRETRAARAARMEQDRLRAEVAASAQAAAARKRCNVMGRGDARLMPRAVCNHGSYTTFVYTGMAVPALFGVDAKGDDVKVQQQPVPGQPGLIVVRATSEFWRARAGGVQVAEFWDASYDPVGIPTTGTDTASPYVRMTVPDSAVRRTDAAAGPGAPRGWGRSDVAPAPPPAGPLDADTDAARDRAVMRQATRDLRELQARMGVVPDVAARPLPAGLGRPTP